MSLFSARRVLVVAAHADDETLGAGGTIARLVQAGARVAVLIVTECGVAGRYPNGDLVAASRRRRAECEAAAEILGVKQVYFERFREVEIIGTNLAEVAKRIAAVVEVEEAETVFTHDPNDSHQDHRAVGDATWIATRPFVSPQVRRLYAYEITARDGRWSGRLAVDITDTLKTKLQALASYTSELRPFPHIRSLEAVEHLARAVGPTAGMAAAEMFNIVWEVER